MGPTQAEARARVVVTGASGFLGRHIARALAARGAEVIAAVRDPARVADLPGADARACDVLAPASLYAAFNGADVVVANAALGSGAPVDADYHAVNVRGAVNTVEAAAAVGARRVVLISTVAVYRAQPWRVLDEHEPLRDEAWGFDFSRFSTDPRYSATKLASERAATRRAGELGLEVVVLRPGPIYGSGDTRFTARMLRLVERRVRVVPTVGVPLVHAGDVAAVAARAALTPKVSGVVANVAGEPMRLDAFVRQLARRAGAGGVTVPLPVPLGVRFDCTAARRHLGFAPREVAEGIDEVVRGRG